MPPPNEQDGKYRRRPAASSSSSSPNGSIDSGNDSSNDYYFADPAIGMGAHRAVAAAEAAVSSILSDAPLATFSSPKGALNLRGRANAVSGAHSGTSSFYMNNNNDTKAETGAKTLQNASLVTKLKQLLWKFFNMIISRGPTTQQPYRREKSAMLIGLKKREILSVIILLFAVGIFFLGGHVHKDAQHSTMRGAYHAIVSIPPPPRHEKHHSATTGSLKNDWEKSKHVTHEKLTTKHNDEIHLNNPERLPKSSASESIEPNIDNHPPDKTILPQPTDHHHAIPPILIFTYHTNLLTTPHSQLKDAEDIALSKNIQQIVSLHPHTTTRFLNDADCLQSIRNTLGNDTKLTAYFTNESHGMYKADICRGAALYETGGLYFDIDIEARMSLWDVIDRETAFVTTLVHKDSNHLGGFFQAFIGVTAGHPVMKRYLELFVDYYEGRVSVNGPLGVYFLRMAYDELLAVDNDTGDGKVKNDDRHRVELWQEIKYKYELFPNVKKPPGKRRACQMLVVAPEKEFPDGWKRERLVPFYSHATGSRMCGGHDTKL